MTVGREEVRFAVAVLVIVMINAIITIASPVEAEEIPVVYLQGISGPLNQQKFEEALCNIRRNPQLTVAQEFELLEAQMGYHEAERRREAADVATAAVVAGYNASLQMQEQLQEQLQEQSASKLLDERLMCTTIWEHKYTQNEVHMLGDLIWLEAEEYCDDPLDGEYIAKLVGSVPLHRMVSDYFPNSLYGVIHQGEGTKMQQYASGTIKLIGNVNPDPIVYEWAEEILKDGPIGPANLVFQANFHQGDEYLKYGKLYFGTANVF